MFTDINVPADTFKDMLRRQAVVNDGVTLVFNDRTGERAEKIEYFYEHGIQDYANEIAGEGTLTPVHFCSGSAIGRDRDDQPEYQVKMNVAFCFSNAVQTLEYYHNSSWLEHGGAPDRAVRLAFVNQINNWLKNKGLYKKNESSITFNDVQDCLILVSSSFSTRTSYENQTKKAITNKFVAQAMTEFLKHQLEVYFVEHPDEAEKACKQVLINKQSREHAEKARVSIKKNNDPADGPGQPRAEICGLPHQGCHPPRTVHRGGRFRYGRGQTEPRFGVPGYHAHSRQDPELPEGRLRPHFQV